MIIPLRQNIRWFLVLFSFLLTACSQTPSKNPDPWEGFNRKVFTFNEAADKYLLTPVAKSYRAVTPDPVEEGVSNMFDNLGELTTIINDLLQFRLVKASSDTGRFLINSTVGVLGFFDVASHLGLEEDGQDFGLTLARWGVNNGPYLMLPFLGPSTIRDGVGRAVDSTSGSDFISELEHVPTRNQLLALKIVDLRAGLLQAEGLISGDKYIFIRDVYLQHRAAKASDEPIVDSFGEEDFEEW